MNVSGNMQRRRWQAAWACTTLFGMLSGVAVAGPGDHVRVGEAEIVPQVLLGTQFRSNVYLADTDTRSGVSLIVHPSATMKLDGKDLKMRALGAYDLRKYFEPELSNLDRFRDGAFEFDLRALPDSLIGVDLKESLVSSSRESESWTSDSALIQHLKNELSGKLAIHPGEALEGGLGGKFVFDDYNVPESANVAMDPNYNSRLTYGPEANFKWRFFPRTAVVLDASMEWFSWSNHTVNIENGGGNYNTEIYGDTLAIPDGWLMSVKGGLRGRFTERVTLGLVAGYNDAGYDEQSVLDDPGEADASEINPAAVGFDADPAGAEKLAVSATFQYDLSETHKAILGYERALTDSYFTNYLVYNYVFLRYDLLLGTRVGVGAEAGYRYEDFHGEVSRADHVVRTRFGATYAANKWLQANSNFQWDRRVSAGHEFGEIEYDDVGVNLGLTFVY